MKRIFAIIVAVSMAFSTLCTAFAAEGLMAARQLFDVFNDYETKVDGADINVHNSTVTGEWKYAASAENGTRAVRYQRMAKDGDSKNIVVAYGDITNQARLFPSATSITRSIFETEIMFDIGSNNSASYQLRFVDTNDKKNSLIIKWTGNAFEIKIDGTTVGSITSTDTLCIGKWITLKVECDASENKKMAVTMGGQRIEGGISNAGTLKYIDYKNATTGCITYMDNTSITDADTQNYIYYGEPAAVNIDAVVGEDISELYVAVPYVLSDGSATGYSMRFKVKHDLSTASAGNFTQTVIIGETGKSVTINLTVRKHYMYEIDSLLIGSTDGYGAFGIEEGAILKSITVTKTDNSAEDATLSAVLYDKNGNKIAEVLTAAITASCYAPDTAQLLGLPSNTLSLGENNPDECSLVLEIKNSDGDVISNSYTYRNDVIDETTTVYLVGDSTAASYSYASRPRTGWGEMFVYHLDSSVKFLNKAVGGRSSKSFISEGRLADIINAANKGDYLLVQFGHNDRPVSTDVAGSDDEAKRSTPEEYKTYLKSYISSAREKGMIPVLITPIVEGNYTNGTLSETKAKFEYQLGEYAKAMRETAKETSTVLIDAYALTQNFFNGMSEAESWKYYMFCEATKYYTNAQKDTTHLQKLGAEAVADMIADELKETDRFSNVIVTPLRNYDIAENYITEDFENYASEDIGKQAWAWPFALVPDLATENFTVEYENEGKTNKIGKMAGRETGESERTTVFFNKLSGGMSEIGMKMKLAATANDRITIQLYGSYSILMWIELASNSSGQYRIICYTPIASTGTAKTAVVALPYTIAPQSGSSVNSIDSGEWFDISLVMREDSRSYDLYVNGLQAAVNIPYFYNGYIPTAEDIAEDNDIENIYYRIQKMYLYTGTSSASELCIDNLYAKDYMSYAEPVSMEMDMYKGETASLPETALVRMDDGHTVKELPVKWSSSPDSSTSGAKTVTGTIEGIGKATAITVNVKELPLEAESFVLKDANGQVYSTMATETKIGVNVKKYTSAAPEGDVYICVYDSNGRLIKAKKISMAASDWENVSERLYETELSAEEGSSVRAFVLNNSLTPLSMKNVFDDTVKNDIKIFLAGDSTVCPYKDEQRPQAGWGEYIGNHFTDNVTVVNKAVGSRSTKSFYNEGRLDAIFSEASKGDYLFIQLGHNDTGSPRGSHTEADTTYKEYLALYVNKARENGMYPVLITPVERFGFVNNVMKSRHGDYPQAMIEVAQEMNVPLIDLRAKSNEYYTELGEAASKEHYMVAKNDYTHLTQTGAAAMAELIAEGIEELKLPVAKYLNVK